LARVDDRVKHRFRQLERAVRPRSVAAIRQAGEVARAVDALEAATAALQVATAELVAQRALLEQLAGRPVPTTAPANDDYDRQTDLVMQRVLRPTDNCLDVGANEGLILERMVALAPDGHHHAFEPIPGMAAALRERFPSVQVHEVALSAEAGEATFHFVTSNPSYSGLRERRYDRPEETVELITVRQGRMDDEVPDDLDVRLIKVDVEGGEEGVFRGGLGTIERCRPYIVFEHGLGAADHYGTKPQTIHELLTGVDLEVTLLSRYLAGEPVLGRDEFVDEFESGRNYYFMAHPAGG
jgi:FkbM family methyltransferase